jgi:hypothetical protein
MDSDWKVDCSDDENYGLTYSSMVSDRNISQQFDVTNP